MPAKVHQITHRHHIEVGLNLYTRRLDKIYENLGKSPMLPKVIKKMREEYASNPHEFYIIVCKKYNITPEPEIDAYRLVYGRTQFEKHDYEFDKNNRESAEKESKEVVHEVKEEEPPTPEEEDEEEEEEEEKDEPEPPKKESKYKFEMPDRPASRSSPRYEKRSSPRYEQRSSPRYEQRSSPRYETTSYRRSSPRNEQRGSPRRSSPRNAPSLPPMSVNIGSTARKQVLGSPRAGSPRALYRFNKGQSVEQLNYVNVNPGDIVETMVLTGKSGNQESGFWIPAQILVIDEKNEVMDLQVLHPIKYGLAQKAVGVPYRYVRKPANIVWKR